MKWSQKKELIVGGLSWHLNGFKFINKPFTKFAFYFFFLNFKAQSLNFANVKWKYDMKPFSTIDRSTL
jgi:hypothetical protein